MKSVFVPVLLLMSFTLLGQGFEQPSNSLDPVGGSSSGFHCSIYVDCHDPETRQIDGLAICTGESCSKNTIDETVTCDGETTEC